MEPQIPHIATLEAVVRQLRSAAEDLGLSRLAPGAWYAVILVRGVIIRASQKDRQESEEHVDQADAIPNQDIGV